MMKHKYRKRYKERKHTHRKIYTQTDVHKIRNIHSSEGNISTNRQIYRGTYTQMSIYMVEYIHSEIYM